MDGDGGYALIRLLYGLGKLYSDGDLRSVWIVASAVLHSELGMVR